MHSQNGFQITKAADKNTIPRDSLKKTWGYKPG